MEESPFVQVDDDQRSNTTGAPPGGLTDTDTHRDSNSSRPAKYSEQWWSDHNNAGRCKRIKRDGEQCRRPAWAMTSVCGHHGARAPQVRRKARQRLEEATDRMARELLKMATDEKTSEAVKLRAITEALDRGNLGAKTEIEISASPLEQIMQSAATSLETSSRADWRRSQGQADDDSPLAGLAALSPGGAEPIDAEIVDADEYAGMRAARPDVNAGDQPETPGDDAHARAQHTARRLRLRDESERDGGMEWVAATAATPAPADRMMTVVEGAEYLAELRRTAALARQAEIRDAGHAVIRRPQRELPPGRSAR